MQAQALLIAPAPVDGYPPVHALARLLARAGVAVTVLSTPRRSGTRIAFVEPGVHTIALPVYTGRFARIPRLFSVLRAIRAARRETAPTIEVAYDPLAMLGSDLAPHRPPLRIAHFHEALALDRWVERRLRRAIHGFDQVVVPDAARGIALRDQLALPVLPLATAIRPRVSRDTVEVVYCGVLGRGQNLPMILRSVPQWPANVRLTLIGDDTTGLAQSLRAQVAQAGLDDRVTFTGWLDLADLPARLTQADLGICLLDDRPAQFRTALSACNKRYQYMQAGLAQIGDRNPGVAGLLQDNSIGRCIHDYTPQAIATLVRHYASDRTTLMADGARAAALHQSRFNYQAAAAPLLASLSVRTGHAA